MSDDSRFQRHGVMLVLSSPSGAGKTSLAKRLLQNDPEIVLSVSATTRAPRPGEKDGVDYHFVSEEEFFRMRDNGEFLEWANVFGKYYATPAKDVDEKLQAGCDVLFDIDWQGAEQLSKARKDLVKVFILPPSRNELDRRLRARAQDPEEVVQRRMAQADEEMSHWDDYHYVIVNANLEKSEIQLRAILTAERLRRRLGVREFVDAMRREN